MTKHTPTTQFKNKTPAKWLKNWEFYTTRANEVNIYNDGYFLVLDDNKNLVVYDIDGPCARLKLSETQIYKMKQMEETLVHMQIELDEKENNNVSRL